MWAQIAQDDQCTCLAPNLLHVLDTFLPRQTRGHGLKLKESVLAEMGMACDAKLCTKITLIISAKFWLELSQPIAGINLGHN